MASHAPASSQPADTTAETASSDDMCDEEAENPNLTRMFTFSTLGQVSKLARLVGTHYHGTNSLYKDDAYGTYILVVTKGSHSREEYNRFCNMLSEYGNMQKAIPAAERFLEEHFTTTTLIRMHSQGSLALMLKPSIIGSDMTNAISLTSSR